MNGRLTGEHILGWSGFLVSMLFMLTLTFSSPR
jgi:hypothetical protein